MKPSMRASPTTSSPTASKTTDEERKGAEDRQSTGIPSGFRCPNTPGLAADAARDPHHDLRPR